MEEDEVLILGKVEVLDLLDTSDVDIMYIEHSEIS